MNRRRFFTMLGAGIASATLGSVPKLFPATAPVPQRACGEVLLQIDYDSASLGAAMQAVKAIIDDYREELRAQIARAFCVPPTILEPTPRLRTRYEQFAQRWPLNLRKPNDGEADKAEEMPHLRG